MHILFALALLASPEDAELSHAEGLLFEVDGKLDLALGELRKAAEAEPKNVDYAADAARLAWKLRANGAEADAERFLALSPKTADQWLLRSYLQAQRGENANAKAAVKQSLALSPRRGEALTVSKVLDEAPDQAVQKPRAWNLRGHAGMEFDSNVTLIQDARPLGQAGGRFNLGVGGGWLPRTENTQFSLGAQLRLGIHVNHREPEAGEALGLKDLDFFNAYAAATSDTRFGSNRQQRFAARVFTDQTTLRMFNEYFMGEYGAAAEYGYTAGIVTPGVYGEGSFRDFATGRFNQPDRANRDGFRWAAGGSLALGVRDFATLLRAGFQTEWAFGADQRELGPSVSLGARYAVWRLQLQGTIGYDGRLYTVSANDRRDHRMPVSLGIQLNANRYLGFELSYLFIRNFSNIDAFDYARHITGLTVKGSF